LNILRFVFLVAMDGSLVGYCTVAIRPHKVTFYKAAISVLKSVPFHHFT
jgi:hypothetical protein